MKVHRGKHEIPFMDYQMGAGEGKRKIGSYMQLQQDTYAVLFCGLIKSEYKEAINSRGTLYKTEINAEENAADVTADFKIRKNFGKGSALFASSAKPNLRNLSAHSHQVLHFKPEH